MMNCCNAYMFDERFTYTPKYDKSYQDYHQYKHSNIIKKYIRHYIFKKKLHILWQIADYYTAKKYHPNNILKYIILD